MSEKHCGDCKHMDYIAGSVTCVKDESVVKNSKTADCALWIWEFNYNDENVAFAIEAKKLKNEQ